MIKTSEVSERTLAYQLPPAIQGGARTTSPSKTSEVQSSVLRWLLASPLGAGYHIITAVSPERLR